MSGAAGDQQPSGRVPAQASLPTTSTPTSINNEARAAAVAAARVAAWENAQKEALVIEANRDRDRAGGGDEGTAA